MTALAIGTVLALAALVFVLYPIFVAGTGTVAAPARPRRRTAAGESPRELAVAALREIEFDRATGKLSEPDYEQLKRTYTERALQAMRREGAAPAAVTDDELESLVAEFRSRARSCATCGPRPELDALYCSSCGHYLPGSCAHCGAGIDAPGARFCGTCGQGLAA